ncbi:MAG: ABC transporter ATP-binding protein [Planctomycetia bacterium]|nr:ABC transporter ATP-binding protein [Planctomycetia bacterium]
MKSAVSVRRVSKRFRLGTGGHRGYRTLRESFMTAINPSRWISRKSSRLVEGADANEVWAVRDVSFDVTPGEVVGIVGRNGAGKSTLLRVLSRITAPTEGEIELRGRVGSLLEVGTGFHPELTGRENIYLNGSILGMARSEIARKFDEIVAFSEVEKFLDTPVKRYSSGMYVRLAFAVAAHLEPEILIVDEVLAVGDMQFQKKCLGKMGEVARCGRTVLFVSHNMTAVKALCSRGILIEAGRVAVDGSVDETVDRYLTGGSDMARTGQIPEDAPRHQDVPDEARFRSVQLTDPRGNPTNQFYYGQPLRVCFTCDVLKDIPDGHWEVSISTVDGTQVTYATTMDGGCGPMFIKKGKHEVAVDFNVTLLPRDYTIDLGVHHEDGKTADFVQRTLDFTVERVAEAGTDHYPWPRSRGFVRPTTAWKLS